MSFGQYSFAEKPSKPALPAKKKRIKTVFGSNDTGIEHVWAHPRTSKKNGAYGEGFEQDFATNPRRNFYFKTHEDGTRVLYSYRDSYPIGARFQVGKRIVFLVRSGKPYSSTTSGHMSQCANAARNNGDLFHVPDVCGPYGAKPVKSIHDANLADYVVRVQESLDKYTRARSSFAIQEEYQTVLHLNNAAKRYARVFGLKLPKLPAIPQQIDLDRIAKAKQREAVKDARDAEKRAAQLIEYEKQCEQRRIENAETIAKWKNGEDVQLPYGLGVYALLRVVNGNVETSQHVTVPIAGPTGAARLLRFLQACKDAGRTYQSNGHSEHIGSFTVQSFGPQTMKGIDPLWVAENEAQDVIKPQEWVLIAGCHRILWTEVQSIADAVRAADKPTDEVSAE